MTGKERYHFLKDQGLCVSCGKAPAGKTVLCDSCYESHRRSRNEIKEYRKSKHICTQCGKVEADPGKTICLMCKMDNRERCQKANKKRNADPAYREKHSALMKARSERCREDHLCIDCGKALAPFETKTRCCECLIKNNRASELRNRKAGRLPFFLRGNGTYCYTCTKQVEIPGSKLCTSCKNKLLEADKKGRKNASKEWLETLNRAFWEEKKARKKNERQSDS